MMNMGCDISGLAESNTNWNNNKVKRNINKIAADSYQNVSSSLSVNRFQPDNTSTFLPGGTIQTCVNHWTGRIIKIISDPRKLGRWSGHQFRIQDDKTLTVITAYRPCQQSRNNIKLESRTAYNQQFVLLQEAGFDHPNPRQIFVADLIKEIKTIKTSPDNYIIVMMDANEDINDKEKGISKLIEETNLVDSFTEFTNSECSIATYARGTKRIDYIFTSVNLVPFIERVGYTAFYAINTSDHRGMFLDLSNSIIDNKVELARPPARHIGSKNKGSEIYKYKEEINKQFINHRIYEKAKAFYEESIQEQVQEKFEDELINLDKQITQIMLAAEKKQCKRKHDSEWSIELHTTSMMCKYWMKQFKGLKNGILVSKQLQKIWKTLPLDKKEEINSKIAEKSNAAIMRISKENMKHYIKYKRELLRHDRVLRQKGLLHLQEIRIAEGKHDKAEIIYRKEMSKQDWHTVKDKFNPMQRSGTSSVEVPYKDENGTKTDDPDEAVTWKRITDPTEIEDTLLARNIKHFGQAAGTLFTTKDINHDFEYEGVSASVERLLAGDYEIPKSTGITPGALQLMNKLGDGNRLSSLTDGITYKEFTQGLRKWSEGTSTSPSGRHLGHYRCLMTEDECHADYNENYKDPKDDILQVCYFIAASALNRGLSLERWQHSITAMIEKIPGCPKINKLRVIHLYEADYNLLLKIIWARRLVWHAHNGDRINDGQAGSRPGRNSIDVVVIKEMKYLHSRLTKTGLATMDNDAKSCYDRIICTLAMIVSQYFGLSAKTTKMQASTLKKMQFRLRPALGESKKSYHHSPETPIHGTGQGSCASPALWLLISSILMDCISDLGGGMSMTDVLKTNVLQQWIDGFVDDTSLFVKLRDGVDQNDVNALHIQHTTTT